MVEAELTPNLRVSELFAHTGQIALGVKRVRMRGAEDPPIPLGYVLQDVLGFTQVAACIGIKIGRRHLQMKHSASWGAFCVHGSATGMRAI